MGDVEINSNTNAISPSDLSSQEFLSTKAWSSSEFDSSIKGANKKHRDVEVVSKDESSSGPFSLHAGLDEIEYSPDNQDSLASLDSSIKYFKSTVQQLFDDFYSNINHFDEFEKTFSGILKQNGNELDIDALINGMVKQRNEEANANKLENLSSDSVEDGRDVFASLGTSREECRNTTNLQMGNTNNKGYGGNGISNCYLFKEMAPYEQKMQQFLSKIEINKNVRVKTSQVTFADNLKKFTLTRKKLQCYLQGHKQNNKEAPVGKFEKKHPNLESLDEEHQRSKYDESSFLNKICHFLCKKFRKSAYLD